MGENQREAARLTYRFDARAARFRARWSAALESAATLAPALLVVALLSKLGAAPLALVWPFAAALALLAIARGFVRHARLLRHLSRFEVTLDDDALDAKSARGVVHVVRAQVERAREFGGALGGLRVWYRPSSPPQAKDHADEPLWLDVPRGGATYAELRSALAAWTTIERPTPRTRGARLVFGAIVVLGIFFVPFILDDLVGRSRFGAVALVGALWLALFFLRRRT
jgi:hypothetical protein